MSLRARLGLPLPRHVGLPLAYVAALLLAPFAVAALGFWAMMIPILAIWFGALPYLVLAGPGFALMLIGMGHPVDWAVIAPFWQLGFYIAPLWGAAFAVLHRGARHLLTAPIT